MTHRRAIFTAGASLLLLSALHLAAQAAPPAQDSTPTLQVNSRLVFLDVTVLDKKGRPVTSGLTQDDFILTEEKRPQRIFSFEAPETHAVSADAENSAGEAPVTIFVLDQLNSTFEQMAYIRYMVHKYLARQPAQLPAPAEVLVLGNKSLELVQGFTRDKADLLSAVDHLPGVLPYKLMNGSFFDERFGQSIEALQEIALQNTGIPGRKNVLWIGHGGPSLYTPALVGNIVSEIDQFVHQTTNMLVDARISLFVIYPWLSVSGSGRGTWSELSAAADPGDTDPFAGDVNFGVFVNATGGKLFFNRNDIDGEIRSSLELGSQYYTLTYQPPMSDNDGRFKRIRVTLRNPALHAVTKVGYYAPDRNAVVSPQQQAIADISEAAHATINFNGLGIAVRTLGRHPDTGTGDFLLSVSPHNLGWQPVAQSKSSSSFMLVAASLSADRRILSSKIEDLTLTLPTTDPARLAKAVTHFNVTLRVPKKAKTVRFILRDLTSGRMGTVEISRAAVDQAPASPTPEPQLQPRTPLAPRATAPPPAQTP